MPGHDLIIESHETLMDWFAQSDDPISPPGVKNQSLLESAAARPHQTVDGKDAYLTIYDKSAALFHSLINNHAFHNGNKRTALVCAQVMLAEHGLWLEYANDDEMFEFTRQAAAHEITENRSDEVMYISEWLNANSRKAMKGERPLKYNALKQALERFGFDIDPPDGNYLCIYKNGVKFERIIKQGIKGFRPYHTDYISGIRKRLGLTTENGVDSVLFYGDASSADTASIFIELRMEVMRRLAKT